MSRRTSSGAAAVIQQLLEEVGGGAWVWDISSIWAAGTGGAESGKGGAGPRGCVRLASGA
jgi:hypothetical protein